MEYSIRVCRFDSPVKAPAEMVVSWLYAISRFCSDVNPAKAPSGM